MNPSGNAGDRDLPPDPPGSSSKPPERSPGALPGGDRARPAGDTSKRHQRVKDLFLQACRLDSNERAGFLDQACGNDRELRREVQSLLAHHQPGSSFLDPVLDTGVLAGATVLMRAGMDSSPTGTTLTSPPVPEKPRFEPGTVINNRYRVLSLLGRGGMGDVYRADDLMLLQPVALKFLPTRLASDTKWLERFHNEVRMARQISHPNVCRVYDVGYCDQVQSPSRSGDSSGQGSRVAPSGDGSGIGEEESRQVFLSMEYVDGEDLASLLRRIGRLPKDKAIQIARQLCSGLAAAHKKGVLHRDLKPTNIMIDGEGQVRITDFGLAAPLSGLSGQEIRAGTPAYMAPEQLAGREVSVRSDVYSMGLVLYEMFTGRPAFKGQTAREYARLHSQSTPAQPSNLVEDMDDAVERVILRCLEKDPRQRPPSALAVMAALPGGDPLAAALEAGETPSPEMVAAAGESGVMNSSAALALLGASFIGIVLVLLLADRVTLVNQVPLNQAPQVLAQQARQIISSFGYDNQAVDRVYGFADNKPLMDFTEADDGDPARRWEWLQSGQPAAVHFWYRQSPIYLVPNDRQRRVNQADPPQTVPGMITVVLDPDGRLVDFRAVPQLPEGDLRFYAPSVDDDAPEPNWELAFAAAGLDFNAFMRLDAKRLPPVYGSRRATWIGQYGDDPPVVLEIDAAGYNGKIVYFSLMPPWRADVAEMEATPGSGARPGTVTRRAEIGERVQSILFVFGLGFGAILAWGHLKTGRGDRRGAFRVALFIFIAGLIEVALGATHVPLLLPQLELFGEAAGHALYRAVQIWLFYMALEPFLRRIWPETIISWSRLLAGRFRDPLIGHDILIGAVFAIWALVLVWTAHLLPGWLYAFDSTHGLHELAVSLNLSPSRPTFESTEELMRLLGPRYALMRFADVQFIAMFYPLLYMLVLLLLRVTVRKPWLMIGIFVIVVAGPQFFGPNWVIRGPVIALLMGVMSFMLIRYGLVTLVTTLLVFTLLTNFPLTTDIQAWYALPGYIALTLAAGLVLWGFYLSQAGRPLLRDEMF